ncbi:GNAT family N-acetyltransferase [Mucilaginibacter sp. Bleaf8]|uniref:GNAT family N-acetyltransferase n=1 Tax=Mucilaginibacter sp. Bleaf8 TaxID=2834430 RepID=UPI001BCCE04B|nr:GNAT family N-acetyltransferase [Mucilaginibacter sp. Bleaf8]MBS7566348.1 GNAT family N-acetyltransferase [Mucilaginibacter sp. Bleaf8]
MLHLETDRLKIIPLNYTQLLLCSQSRAALEATLGLQPSDMKIDTAFRAEMDQAMHNYWLPNTKAYPELYPWYTNWEIVLKDINTAIGGIGFGGYPDDYGTTSVGYVISQQRQGKGYATEALLALLEWGFSFSVLKQVDADTTPGNIASQRVLLKAGFKQISIEPSAILYQRRKGI